MSLIISQDLHHEIRTYLEGAFPHEGGGFLIGDLDGDSRIAQEVRFEENKFDTEEQYHRYLMEKGAFQAAEDYADEKGLTLIGYFHSHPNHPAIPSEYDREHALPNFLYLIVSVREGVAAESKTWILNPDRAKFNEITLEETR